MTRLMIMISMALAILAAGTFLGYRLGIYRYDQLVIQIQQEYIDEKERLEEAKEQLDQEVQILEAEVEKLNEEARNDPDANKPSVSKRGVQRLNSIR